MRTEEGDFERIEVRGGKNKSGTDEALHRGLLNSELKEPISFRTEEREWALKMVEESKRGKGFKEDDVIKAVESPDFVAPYPKGKENTFAMIIPSKVPNVPPALLKKWL